MDEIYEIHPYVGKRTDLKQKDQWKQVFMGLDRRSQWRSVQTQSFMSCDIEQFILKFRKRCYKDLCIQIFKDS